MANSPELTGILTAIITPFADGGGIDVVALDQHVNRLVDAGVHGLVPGGSTGEFTALTVEERRTLTETCIKSAAGRIPVVAGTGDLTSKGAVELAVHAAQAGAAAVMVIPPYYEAPNLEETRELLQDIHTASGLPIVYYNIPSISGLALSAQDIASLSDVGVKYLKDTSGNAPVLTDLLFTYGQKITTFNGWDTLTFYGLAAGAKGSIWGAVNIIPELSAELWNALAVEDDLKKGREVWEKIFPICKWLETHHYYASAIKSGMELRGWKTGGVRKPFAPLKEGSQAELAALLETAGVKL
ncbi:dihydrodipicolinate synthase [Colletotrichum scovillei]|uniref:Dihydrodipicolinate synthase n=1 Tax=Colletotrichum scovillei TaxID=1209932 RepID=A0A9P7QWL8_9PEZI|nr:dihydrodipicolinate synthase [Colletotrichum scovillei]KAF4774859.1 dihydrodipicolinate synthase [Colletotrichum scovillei]KAG7042787.1 dihydrodipicolinate synthase [Colletotrichum scovillei]KAG7043381.1 dihydrodipicolinate synthase [Colletotrichum scovillei]KAG7062829.1 dihydrodipicolinate synthase [Colletotrichum scovillei]